MKIPEKFLSKRSGIYIVVIIALYLLFVLFDRTHVIKNFFGGVWNMISPIIIGIIVAYLFNPVSSFFERTLFKKIGKDQTRHMLGVIITAVCFLLAISLLLLALVPSLIKSITRLISNWNVYTSKVQDLLARISLFLASHNIKVDLTGIENAVENSMVQLLDLFKNNYKNILQKAGEIGTGISNYAIGIIFGFCFLMAKSTILNVIEKIRRAVFKEGVLKRHNEVFARCHKVFIRYVGCTLLDALIIGVATFIFTLCTGMPYSPLIAVVVAVTNIVPTFGPMIGAVIGVFFIILESPVKAFIFLIFIIVLQSLDGMVIKPRLFSGSLGIPAVWTLVMIILSGRIAGVWGIILSIPILAILEIIFKQTTEPFLEKRAAKINMTEE